MPTTSPKSILLHLTDLHFGAVTSNGHYWNSEASELRLPKYDRQGLLGSLRADLDRIGLLPDIVIVSGDLLDRGARTGVRPAGSFLEKLADGLNVPRDHVVLVPGNHDVLRLPKPAERYAYFDEIRNGFYGPLRKPFLSRTAPYNRVEHFDFGDKFGIEVIAFNSCEALQPPTSEYGSVGERQRKKAESFLAATESKGLFRIAVMHHHLDRPTGLLARQDISVVDDSGIVREWLARHHFRLALHGHQHVDWDESRLIDGWFLSITAGASAGVGRYGRAEWELRLGYQLIVIDTQETGRRIRREYDPASRAWMAAGHGPPEKQLHFGAKQVVEQLRASAGTRRPDSERVPTKGSLREILKSVLRIDAHFDAFCHDHFPNVAGEFSEGMTRARKITLLLQLQSPARILSSLRQTHPEAVALHDGLLAYE